MAATLPSAPDRQRVHSTGRFDYALPEQFRSSGGEQSLYTLEVSQLNVPPGTSAAAAWKSRLAATASARNPAAAASVPVREFDLPGVGPAAWMQLSAKRPDLVTLLAMKPVPGAAVAVVLQVEASAGREPVAERVFTKVAASYVPGSPQGFSAGPGAFVIAPSRNERALDSLAAPGVDITVETETVAAPDDGQSSDGDPPPGGKKLLKHRRSVGGFDGIEERVQVPDDVAGTLLVYTWIFAGRAADGAAPRIRLSASGAATHAAALDAAWNSLLASWRQRPLGVR